MNSGLANPVDQEQQMLHAMVGCAYEFGTAFAAEARAAEDHVARIDAYERFQQCFLAVRMGIRLRLRLSQQAASPRAEARVAVEREVERAEGQERPEREPEEREQDRDYEPVSLPAFLDTLGVVRADAARLGDRLPAPLRAVTLPKLAGLLAEAGKPSRPSARSRLAAGTAAGALVLDRPLPQLRSPSQRRGPKLSQFRTPGSG